MIARHVLIWLHRWIGLAVAPLLIIVALTGSIIAFYSEIDRWLNPELLTVTVQPRPMLDPFTLRERAEAIEPRATADDLRLDQDAGHAFSVWLTPKVDSLTGQDFNLESNQMLLDPYNGDKLGARRFGDTSLDSKNLMSIVYRLHYSLLLPDQWHETGRLILGIVALAWTVDCFVGFYLTLPVRRPHRRDSSSLTAWLRRWQSAWHIKTGTSRLRIIYDVHRSLGLWSWVMLFVLAWSGVAFNLPHVYGSVMSAVLPRHQQGVYPYDGWLDQPKLGWREGYKVGRRHMSELLSRTGHAVKREVQLKLDREHATYIFGVKTTADIGDKGYATRVIFDANTGELLSASGPGAANERLGDIVHRWLTMLHQARVFGLPMQIVVCVMGLIVTGLSLSGVLIFLRKRRARSTFRDAS